MQSSSTVSTFTSIVTHFVVIDYFYFHLTIKVKYRVFFVLFFFTERDVKRL